MSWLTHEHGRMCKHTNGVFECLTCGLLFVPETEEMRKLYNYPQFKVEWVKKENNNGKGNTFVRAISSKTWNHN